ncbi:MAG: glycosyltransferase family 2 protein [Desulfobacterales bacterium]|nr:glycosyltransferase family 2 protein [Desulfobacterales bacterium]
MRVDHRQKGNYRVSEAHKPALSVILPAYNEEQNIPIIVARLEETFHRCNLSGEVVLVNDGSTDRSQEVMLELTKSLPNITVVSYNENRGKLTALRCGCLRASGEVIVMMDTDLQCRPEEITWLLSPLEQGYDVVNGWRDYKSYQTTRTMFSKLYNILVRVIFGVPVHDSNCGFKAWRREVSHNDSHIFDYGLPLIIPYLAVRGYKIAEVKVSLEKRKYGESKYYREGALLGGSRNITDLIKGVISLLRLLSHRRRLRNEGREFV